MTHLGLVLILNVTHSVSSYSAICTPHSMCVFWHHNRLSPQAYYVKITIIFSHYIKISLCFVLFCFVGGQGGCSHLVQISLVHYSQLLPLPSLLFLWLTVCSFFQFLGYTQHSFSPIESHLSISRFCKYGFRSIRIMLSWRPVRTVWRNWLGISSGLYFSLYSF